MVFCAVYNCSRRTEANSPYRFFRFPSIKTYDNEVCPLRQKRLMAWIMALRRGDLTESKIKFQRVCSRHFVSGQPSDLNDTENVDWVPSVNMGYDKPSSVLLKKRSKKTSDNSDGEVKKKNKNKESSHDSGSEESLMSDVIEGELKAEPTDISSPGSSTVTAESEVRKQKNGCSKRSTVVKDEFDTYGQVVASKMRRMSDDQRLIMEHLFNNILFYGLKGMLQETAFISSA